ncbi:MAG: 1-(5-phosphoribosyl)-5-[(5-phosphoribosylamino)methylideneamino]imidazole-4-carboxamide isomerase [Chloroflexi bacterium]|nr:1-(5-phosphoribosyl)-5-[(5-phosphoribosylamino)methylideneamino]imidazole-4-carboxamide isomerase [Chloroflexota bacterium]
MFEIIPAIDLQGGRCVRLVQGDFDRSTVYGDDPAAMARRWEAAGATRIHVVDLDGAKDGEPRQLAVVKAIADAVSVPVQLGGGLRTLDHIQAAVDAGVDRVMVGTKAIEDPSFVDWALGRFGGLVGIGIDARDGRVAVRGWVDVSDVDALDLARQMAERGVKTIVYTDISRDGMLTGPNLDAMRKMAQAVPTVGVIASGGVGQPQDIIDLAETGTVGVIVGKAIYTGNVDLGSAIEALASRASG